MFKATAAALKGSAVALVVAASLAAAPNADALTKQERRALAGAIVGGVAGSLLSNGDPWATAGGALAGGVIGNATTRDRDHRDRNYYDRNYNDRNYNDRNGERWREDARQRDWERSERERREREWNDRERERREYWRNR